MMSGAIALSFSGGVIIGLAKKLYAISTTRTKYSILLLLVLGILCYHTTSNLVPVAMRTCKRNHLHGIDVNKSGTSPGELIIPESIGIVAGCVTLVSMVLYFSSSNFPPCSGSGYIAAMTSICFMLFLGFGDDVLDIPWRYKLLFPAIASLPLIAIYDGPTAVLVPLPVQNLLQLYSIHTPVILDIGLLYNFYMCLLTVFCTNSINILAGVNGLEVGQSVALALSIIVFSLSYLISSNDRLTAEAHIFCCFVMVPFTATSLALLKYNQFPSVCFVGDSYTYFAGMSFAAVGILGHFSETLLLFFLPQIFNFIYSLPQLLKFLPCPRHRLPSLDKQSGLLHASNNYNVVNLVLHIGGPCTEDKLCAKIVTIQFISCIGAFLFRAMIVGVYKS